MYTNYQFTKAAEIKTYLTEGLQTRKYLDIMKTHTWEVIEAAIEAIKPRLKPNWEIHYWEQSVTLRTKSRSRSIKLTAAGEVYVDIRLKNKIDFRSTKYSGASIEDAAEAFKFAMEEHLVPVVQH